MPAGFFVAPKCQKESHQQFQGKVGPQYPTYQGAIGSKVWEAMATLHGLVREGCSCAHSHALLRFLRRTSYPCKDLEAVSPADPGRDQKSESELDKRKAWRPSNLFRGHVTGDQCQVRVFAPFWFIDRSGQGAQHV